MMFLSTGVFLESHRDAGSQLTGRVALFFTGNCHAHYSYHRVGRDAQIKPETVGSNSQPF